MSTLEESTDNLSPVKYGHLLEAISQHIKASVKDGSLMQIKSAPASISLRFVIDKIAEDVSKQFASSNKYPFTEKEGTVYACVHMPTSAEKDAFSNQVQRLIIQELQAALQTQAGSASIGQMVTNLLKPMSSFSDKTAAGLHYPLEKPYLFEKRRLHVQPKKAEDDPWLKGHKLTLRVEDIKSFVDQMIQGICAFLDQNACAKEDIDEARETLVMMARHPKSSLYRLQESITKESLARIQREARVLYLSYLYEGMRTWKTEKKAEGMKLLDMLVQRLKAIDTFIRQEKEDAWYQVTYQDTVCNFRALFSRADAFDMLPIISEIEGFLGESTDQLKGAKTFVSGLRLKLNGPVQVHSGGGRSVFEYNQALLYPGSEDYRKREEEASSVPRFREKVLRAALLYYFVFVNMDDPAFDPCATFEEEILGVLREGSEAEKASALREIYRKVALCRPKLQVLRQTLEDFLDLSHIGPASWRRKLVLNLKKQILVRDLDSMLTHTIFFQEDFENNNGRDVLKYITIEEANAGSDALCKLPVTLEFEPMYYYGADEAPEQFTMRYETERIQALPVFLAPLTKDYSKYKVVEQTNRVMLYYRHHPEMAPESAQAFVYRFTYLLLSYVFLKLLADSVSVADKRTLFFPIICLHAKVAGADKQDQKLDEETFMHALSRLLSHLLGEDYLSSSQGFHLDTIEGKGPNVYKLDNALYSLYTGLPRRFQLQVAPVSSSAHHLEKLAIIVVSSRKCDLNLKTPKQYLSTVFGEFIGMERLEGRYVRVSTLSTFSINQEAGLMYRRPEAIIEEVKTWYAAGYRHFLYIAQAPYSSTLHISDKGDDEELFFMNQEIIQAIRGVQADTKVYPLFCDKYYVVNQRRKSRKPQQVDSLYLDPAAYVRRHILDIHAALTENELANFTPYLFLTGNPGIGKTTAIVNFLKRRVRQGENFLFMYISPRKQVNLDIIHKFQEDTGEPPCEDLFALTTNSLIIQNNNELPTVHYYSQQRQDTFRENGVYFLFAEGEQAKEQRTARRHLEEIQEGLLIDKGKRISGVLDNLCSALQASITTLRPAPRAIVATVAIQSLKRTKNGQSTLQHLEKIIQGAYSTQHGVLPAQMAKIGQRIRHLFVMIDEVTGVESGAEFLEGIHKFLQKYELMDAKYGIHTKIIVADASIVDPQIIQQHLAETTYEPNKIYFRRVTPQQAQPLSIQSFTFKRKPAVVINANAYPASKLHITYKIGVDALQYEEETFAERRKHLQQAVQARIVNDIMAVLNQPDPPQVLVYIQDKQRLALLIDEIRRVRGEAFEANEQYLEIHANISEEDKKTIAEVQHKVDVVFMTASASRGLSFYRARHILVDIPHFEIEQNLMEILQVIYRGRGGEYDQEEKWLTFYLADQVIYANETDRALSVRESMIHLLNVLLILKTSIMTRIVGSGALGVNQRFMMIPIGGKSVNAAGSTFTSRISRLLKELQDVSHSHRNDRRLTAVHTSLTRILSDVRIDLIGTNRGQTAANSKPAQQSYLNLLPTFTQSFIAATRKGFQHLLALPPLEKGYLSGNLLVVPIGNKSMQERYWMVVEEALAQEEQKGFKFDLLAAMYGLSKDARYPESMHVALKDAIALIESLKDIPIVKNPRYQQESDHADQHYALPLVAFIVYDAMKAYFGSKPEQEEQNEGSFRALLASYVRTLYPADSILPIGSQYDVFPFAVFRCLDLAEARHKLFTDHYLFMSHELNILNMLLAS